jgi:hypothetical protein
MIVTFDLEVTADNAYELLRLLVSAQGWGHLDDTEEHAIESFEQDVPRFWGVEDYISFWNDWWLHLAMFILEDAARDDEDSQ